MAKKHNRTGRSKGCGKYVQLYEYIARSYGWSRLSPLAKVAWLEINFIYNGSNNGRLGVSSRALGDRLGVGKSSAARALDELLRWGFLDCMTSSDFGKKKLAAEYRLTHLPCHVTGDPPSRRFMRIGETNNVVPIIKPAE
jgi:hypothetical protein